MAIKRFKIPRQDHEPLEFELVFERFNGNGEWVEETEKFQARGNVPGNLLMSIVASMAGSAGLQAHEIRRFLNAALIKDDLDRFNELLDDPETAIPIDSLGEIIEWLAGEYGDRPTSKP